MTESYRKSTDLKSEMVRLEGEDLNSLIEALQKWEYHLARSDFKSLRCEDDTFAP